MMEKYAYPCDKNMMTMNPTCMHEWTLDSGHEICQLYVVGCSRYSSVFGSSTSARKNLALKVHE